MITHAINLEKKKDGRWYYQVAKLESGGFAVIETGNLDGSTKLKDVLNDIENRFGIKENQYALYVG